uniref:Uncharacterized protein n=1 Tax=Moniliophthora roreri TaxID=221103 RepID=A0A0W0F9S0_MONRR
MTKGFTSESIKSSPAFQSDVLEAHVQGYDTSVLGTSPRRVVSSTSIDIDIIYNQCPCIHFGHALSGTHDPQMETPRKKLTKVPTSPSPSTSTLALVPTHILHEDNRRQHKPGLGIGFGLPSRVSLTTFRHVCLLDV